MNLEKLNVVELDAQEKLSVDGGILPALLYGGALLVEVVCYSLAAELIINNEEYAEQLENAVGNCEC